MNCNCSVSNVVLSIIILIVAIWPGLLGTTASMWITIIAAALLLIHSLIHKHSMPSKRR
ncbi:MAG TPA: hypothetical protein VJK03_00840 [Candidatus Nanoarchaeia archaeon]|nr:hypothetical protein [Candidatus Nanoarchaeia archaeon]